MLGLEGRVGALQEGADGNVVLYSGDPLSSTSFVEFVVLGGDLVYDRSKDIRTRHLLEGVQPEGTAVDEDAEVEEEAGDGEDDE